MNAQEGKAKASGTPDAAPATLAELMAMALVIETEAAERYGELADAMEMHNNAEVAALFRRMQQIEMLHEQSLRTEMGRQDLPAPVAAVWRESPETALHDDVHYLMQPYHALEIALAAEERAERFFTELAQAAVAAPVREAAQQLAAEEREHVELVRQWMKKVPAPDRDWAVDPDPPRYTD